MSTKARDDQLKKASNAAAKAAKEGDLETVRTLLAAEPELVKYTSAMLKACAFGQVDIVRLLLDAGADPNQLSNSGTDPGRPLDRTCCICSMTPWTKGHEATIRLLVERGADLKGRGRKGLTPLALAAWHHDDAGVAVLLELGAGADTDIFEAATMGDAARVRELLAHEPSLARAQTPDGEQPLELAAGSRWYRQGDDVAQGLAEVVQLLLDHGAGDDPEEIDEALRWSCGTGSPTVAELLLRRSGGNPESFRRLLGSSRVALLELVDRRDWDIEGVRDAKSGNHHLAECLRNGNFQSAHWLLNHGADPNVANNDGWTALHYAARRNAKDDLIEYLLACGAEPTAENADGQTPLDVAVAFKRERVIACLSAAAA